MQENKEQKPGMFWLTGSQQFRMMQKQSLLTVRQRIFPQMMQQKSALIWLEAVKH